MLEISKALTVSVIDHPSNTFLQEVLWPSPQLCLGWRSVVESCILPEDSSTDLPDLPDLSSQEGIFLPDLVSNQPTWSATGIALASALASQQHSPLEQVHGFPHPGEASCPGTRLGCRGRRFRNRPSPPDQSQSHAVVGWESIG